MFRYQTLIPSKKQAKIRNPSQENDEDIMLTPYKLYQFLDVSSGTGTPAPGFPPQPPAPRAVEVVQPFFFEWVRDIWESQKALAPDCKFDIHYTYIYIYIER